MMRKKINSITGEITMIEDGLPETEQPISVQEPTIEDRVKASEDALMGLMEMLAMML